jgi:putative transposase
MAALASKIKVDLDVVTNSSRAKKAVTRSYLQQVTISAQFVSVGSWHSQWALRLISGMMQLDISRSDALAASQKPMGHIRLRRLRRCGSTCRFEASRIAMTVVKRTDRDSKGFTVLPKSWVVERTLRWINRACRLAKDFEATIGSSLAWFMLALAALLLTRFARYPTNPA